MDKVNKIKMDDHNLLLIISGLATALGLKEVWAIIKTKLQINAQKEERADHIQFKVIEELKNKIETLELKIDSLIKENTMLREKLARMEERLLVSAKKRVNKRRDETE